MTDIVERLRDYARRAFDGYPAPRRDAAEAMSNAADEIERLRAVVAQYEHGDLISVPIEPSDEMLDAADSAIPRFEPGPDCIRVMGVDGAALCLEAKIDAIRARMEAKP